MRQSKDNFSGESTRKTGRWKIVLTVFILIAVILTAVVLVLFFRNDGSLSIPTFTRANNAVKITQGETWTVCLDAGHGYSDPGSQNALLGGYDEADINLAVAQAAKRTREEHGIHVLMTRDEGSGYNKNADKLELEERTTFCNESNVDLFLSIHCDSFPDNETVCGTRIYYTKNGTYDGATVSFAQKLNKSFAQLSSKTPLLKEMPSDDSYYVIHHTNVPGALIELGFISNEEDAKNLTDADWQAEAGEKILQAVQAYIAEAEHN